jgi:hypothetical protein
MTFHQQLTIIKGPLSAAQVAAAISPHLSRRTVEEWLQDRRTPPSWTQDWILSRVRAKAKHPSRCPAATCSPSVSDPGGSRAMK